MEPRGNNVKNNNELTANMLRINRSFTGVGLFFLREETFAELIDKVLINIQLKF
jgi:hypothetical protein